MADDLTGEINIEEAVCLGKLTLSKKNFWFPIRANSTSSQNRNYLIDAKMGTGKTNLIMLWVFELYKLYMETECQFGALPIIFSPLFEFSNLLYESKDDNLGPDREPEGIECLQYCFQMSNPPEDNKDVVVIYVEFNELTIEDLASFAGYNEGNRILGHLQKMMEDLKKQKSDYDIDDFIEAVRDYKPLYDALYYVFTKLKRQGFFDKKYTKFDWFDAIKQKKPIIFNFGDINVTTIYNTITGYLLRKLLTFSNVYYNAYTKKDRIRRAEEKGEKTDEKLSDDEEFLVKNFYLALFFEESHQILYRIAGNPNLENYPAHYSYRQISDLLGRKKGFKYNFLVTQRIMELYKYFRKQQNFLILGSEVYLDDIDYMLKEMRFPNKAIPFIVSLQKYCFSIIDVISLQSNKRDSIVKFKAFRSPAGQMN